MTNKIKSSNVKIIFCDLSLEKQKTPRGAFFIIFWKLEIWILSFDLTIFIARTNPRGLQDRLWIHYSISAIDGIMGL